MQYLLDKREELNISDWELAGPSLVFVQRAVLIFRSAHSNALIIAGSETSATVLSTMHYYLLKNPDAYAKLKDHVRSAFRSVDEIDAKSATALPFLTACIEETFRIFPPIPIGMPRVTPKGGCTIAGRFVPEGVSCLAHMSLK